MESNKVIYNRVTGFSLKLIQTAKSSNGGVLEVEAVYPEHSLEPPQHYHPYQNETFQILEGELNVRMDNTIAVYKAGDLIFIPQNKVHSMWNASGSKTIVNWKVEPAMVSGEMMAIVAGLANDGYTNNKGVPGILPSTLLINKFGSVFRLPKPPYWVLRILLLPLLPFAYIRFAHLFNKYVKVLS